MADGPPLRPCLDLGTALIATQEVGAAHLPEALTAQFLSRLQTEIEHLPYEPLPDQIGPVRQNADLFIARGGMTEVPAIAELRDCLVRRLTDDVAAANTLTGWWPNEAYVQRYPPGSFGVSPHRDSVQFTQLIAVFTTQGRARFAICRDRSGTDRLTEWQTAPGSLVLVRGVVSGHPPNRPFHTVDGPTDAHVPRFSVTYRMNTHRDT
jgi:hypothetical protein